MLAAERHWHEAWRRSKARWWLDAAHPAVVLRKPSESRGKAERDLSSKGSEGLAKFIFKFAIRPPGWRRMHHVFGCCDDDENDGESSYNCKFVSLLYC